MPQENIFSHSPEKVSKFFSKNARYLSFKQVIARMISTTPPKAAQLRAMPEPEIFHSLSLMIPPIKTK
jgi:hypothetical protein